jgi:hypothetical protein
VEQRVLVIAKDAICFMKNLGEILASQTLHPSIEKPMLDGQAEPPPDRNPSCVAAEESGRRLARVVLESMDAIKLDAVVYPSWNNPASLIGALNSPHDKSADERQSLETKPISRGTESSNPAPSSGESVANSIWAKAGSGTDGSNPVPSSKESATNLTGKIEPALARNRRFESSSLRR